MEEEELLFQNKIELCWTQKSKQSQSRLCIKEKRKKTHNKIIKKGNEG